MEEAPDVDNDSLVKLSASIGWVNKSVKLHRINSVSLHGQGERIEDVEDAQIIANLRRILSKYDSENLHDVDEISLLYKLLPKRTLLPSTTKRRRSKLSSL